MYFPQVHLTMNSRSLYENLIFFLAIAWYWWNQNCREIWKMNQQLQEYFFIIRPYEMCISCMNNLRIPKIYLREEKTHLLQLPNMKLIKLLIYFILIWILVCQRKNMKSVRCSYNATPIWHTLCNDTFNERNRLSLHIILDLFFSLNQ